MYDSLVKYFAMGGYELYVWPCYLAFAFLVSAHFLSGRRTGLEIRNKLKLYYEHQT